MRLILQPNGAFRLGDYLRANLQDRRWAEFKAAVAFAKRSGVKHIRADLAAFCGRGTARIAIGIDCNGTSREGLEALLSAVGSTGQVYVFHNEHESTFHPKLYLFKGDQEASLAIGSGNLTQGGLFTNYEASVAVALDLSTQDDVAFVREVEATLDDWMDPRNPTTLRLEPALLETLVEQGYVLPEERTRGFGDEPGPHIDRAVLAVRERTERLFARVAVRRAPPATVPAEPLPALAESHQPVLEGFVMTLMQTDVGYGQKTKGTSRRSPEVFIPLEARNHAPAFWGWPDLFHETATKWDRRAVRMRVGRASLPEVLSKRFS